MRNTRSVRASVIAVAASIGVGSLTSEANATEMDAYAWSKRPVLVFAASANDQRAQQQLDLLNAAQGQIDERDVIVLAVWPDRVDGSGSLSLDPEDLRAKFGVAQGAFSVLLIGKDTGVKRRADAVIDPSELFGQIDGMPMRQREIRQSN